jgi:acetyltransferase-like isoleucine patch superfamily enzyme
MENDSPDTPGLVKRFRAYWIAGLRLQLQMLRCRCLLALHRIVVVSPFWKPGVDLGCFLLRCIGIRIGRNTIVSPHFFTYDGRNISIGSNCSIGYFCRVFDFSTVEIGDNALVSHNLTLVSGTHDPVTFKGIGGEIQIGKRVWIGANVTVVGPCTIGDDCIIGAGALVLKNIPARAVSASESSEVPGLSCRGIDRDTERLK